MHALALRLENGETLPLTGNEVYVPDTTHAGNTFAATFASELIGRRVWLRRDGAGGFGTIERVRPPREMTPEEVRYLLLRHIKGLVDYWASLPEPKTAEERLSGLAFSLCATLDGSTIELPGFTINVRPSPGSTDKGYHRERGQDWYPDDCDIGPLHDFYHRNPKPNAAGKL